MRQDIINESKNHATNVHISLQKRADMMSQSILRRVDIMSHVINHSPRSQGGQKNKKYLDGSYRCQNVKGANCHSRWFVEWTDSVGQIVAWSVCGWTDGQGTHYSLHCNVLRVLINIATICIVISTTMPYGVLPTALCIVFLNSNAHNAYQHCNTSQRYLPSFPNDLLCPQLSCKQQQISLITAVLSFRGGKKPLAQVATRLLRPTHSSQTHSVPTVQLYSHSSVKRQKLLNIFKNSN
jgi:hypothetical protein